MPRRIDACGAFGVYRAAVNTPALLTRTALYTLGVLSLLIVVVASAVPRGAAFLVTTGFVTSKFENSWLTLRLVPIPGTDPTVYVSVQSAVQMLVIALAVAGVVGLIRTNPWQHGALANSTPPGRGNKSAGASSPPTSTSPVSPPVTPPAGAPPPGPASAPGPPAPPPPRQTPPGPAGL